MAMSCCSFPTLENETTESNFLYLFQDHVKRQTRFVSRKPAKTIISSIEFVAGSIGLNVHSRNYKMRLEGISANKTGQFAVVVEVTFIFNMFIAFPVAVLGLVVVSVVSNIALWSHYQVYEVAPSLFMVDVRKASGDTLEYHK
ncbi:hypothetical protein GIB67_017811, partial [Kingdonia uniflora]